MFPSPIGELHFSILAPTLSRFASIVSVPYRGATFLNHVHRTNGKKNSVSVPYRGATFLNNSLMRLPAGGRKFPSPIGELHFSIPSPQPHVLSGTDRGIAGEK